MKILNKIVSTILLCSLLIYASIELFYQYKIQELHPQKTLSKEKYKELSHDLLWVSLREKGEVKLESFSATMLIYSLVRRSLFSMDSQNAFPKGTNIAYQVARHLLQSSPEGKKQSHLNDAVLSIWVSNNYDKNEAINYVLDAMFYGQNIYGLSSASNHYFHKEPSNLSLSETTSLITLTIGPSRYSPYINPKKHKERSNRLFEQLVENWQSKYKGLNYKFPLFSK